jgi:hypothetical protein
LVVTVIEADCGKKDPLTLALLPCEFWPSPMFDPVYLFSRDE